jgi:hypothetical protein
MFVNVRSSVNFDRSFYVWLKDIEPGLDWLHTRRYPQKLAAFHMLFAVRRLLMALSLGSRRKQLGEQCITQSFDDDEDVKNTRRSLKPLSVLLVTFLGFNDRHIRAIDELLRSHFCP